MAALLDHYGERDPQAGGKWACFRELADRTGGGHRYCDLFVVGLWASNARAIAIEVKVSRSDFQRELEDPSKRSAWDAYATEFYFAVPAGLVAPDEVPEGCGLFTISMVNDRPQIRTVKKARQRKPDPWPFLFCQSLARRAADPLPAFPGDVSLTLTSGTVVNIAQLRRLVDRLHNRVRDIEHRKVSPRHWDSEEYKAEAQARARRERIDLGAMKRTLERHFQARIDSVDHLLHLLASTGSIPPDAHLAAKLRQLADLLSPPAPEIVPGVFEVSNG